MEQQRQQWRSKLGFLLAASGSAIGLGNIVVFSANAYQYGAGAFYLPYLIALVVVGLPVMWLEFGLGQTQQRAFPQAMGNIGGKWGEIAGWWALLNATIITMFYVAILGWVLGMWWKALMGSLWEPTAALTGFSMAKLGNPTGSFFQLISSWSNVIFVVIVWILNIALVLKGARSIETGVKLMMPLMWLFMVVLVIVGLSQPNGINGIYLLFTPNFKALGSYEVWNGAFSQIFFTLSLGFGVMTAYASYLPKKADHTTNALIVSTMNCSFEMISGLAIFTLLFAFALTPKASTLAMMFFVVPKGIAQLSVGYQVLGVLFFTLLLVAGLSSSISLIESLAAAIIDKFQVKRTKVILLTAAIGVLGSAACALPTIIDKGLASNGTLGLTILDFVDHYASKYGLLLVGIVECLIIGWMMPISKLREALNEHATIKIGAWFDVLIKFVIPVLLIIPVALTVLDTVKKGLYGSNYTLGGLNYLPALTAVFWALFTFGGAFLLATLQSPSKSKK